QRSAKDFIRNEKRKPELYFSSRLCASPEAENFFRRGGLHTSECEIEKGRSDNRCGNGHEDHHGVHVLLNGSDGEADLGDYHADLAARHHAHTDAHGVGFAKAEGAQAATDEL